MDIKNFWIWIDFLDYPKKSKSKAIPNLQPLFGESALQAIFRNVRNLNLNTLFKIFQDTNTQAINETEYLLPQYLPLKIFHFSIFPIS